MAGRHGHGSCCCAPGVVVKKPACLKDDYKVLYKVGGEFLSESDYKDHLLEKDQWEGFIDLEEIRYQITKPDYAEYSSELNNWFYPATFFDPTAETDEESLTRKFRGWDDPEGVEDSVPPDANYGVHIPKTWKIVLGDPDDENITIVRNLSSNTSKTRYVNGDKAGILNVMDIVPDDNDAAISRSEIITSGRACLGGGFSDVEDEIDEKWLPNKGGDPNDAAQPGVPNTMHYAYVNGIAPLLFQVEIKERIVEWKTTVHYNGDKIFDGVKCISYLKEYRLFGNGEQLPVEYFPPILDYLLFLDDTSEPNISADRPGEKNAIAALLDYSTFDYCLTYPFFAFDQHTHYFHKGGGSYKSVDDGDTFTIEDGHGDGKDAEGIKYLAKGDKSLNWFHAGKEVFDSIQVTSQDFIVFNPYADMSSIGRNVTNEELARYWIKNPSNTDPTSGEVWGGEDLVKTLAEACWLQDDRWPKLQQEADEKEFQPEDCALEADELKEKKIDAIDILFTNSRFIGTGEKPVITYGEANIFSDRNWLPYFLYTDNKWKFDDLVHPQSMLAEDDSVTFPIALPAEPEGWPGDFADAEGTVTTFKKYTGIREDTEYIDKALLVAIARERNAADAANDPDNPVIIKVGDEVYYPFGSSNIFEVKSIVSTDQRLVPQRIKILDTNDPDAEQIEVGIEEVQLLKDNIYYGITGRTYYLQRRYLEDDFGNPFKYKVNRIDLVNNNIDVGDFGDEVAGPPAIGGDNPVYIQLTKSIDWKFQDDLKYYRLSESQEDEQQADISLALGAPEDLPEGVLATSLVEFKEIAVNKDVSLAAGKNLSFPPMLFASEDAWVLSFVEITNGPVAGRIFTEEIEFLEGLSGNATYKNDQNPAGGYFVGAELSLKFYLEEVEEWKKNLQN